MTPTRTYPCVFNRIVDGDTFVVTIDLGFNITTVQTIRLAGVNAPEMNTPEGREARVAVVAWTVASPVVEIVGHASKDKYGRRLADLRNTDGVLLASWMLDNGWAKVMAG